MTHHQGFTLLEVVISLFLLSIVLLGVNAAQVAFLRQSRGLYYFQQANALAENMAEYLAAYHGNQSGYQQQWNDDIQLILPQSSGAVTGSFPDYRVLIKWGDESRSCDHNQPGVTGCIMLNIQL